MNLLADQSESGIQSSVNHPKFHGGNFNLTGHLTSLIPCKDSNQNLSDLRKKIVKECVSGVYIFKINASTITW